MKKENCLKEELLKKEYDSVLLPNSLMDRVIVRNYTARQIRILCYMATNTCCNNGKESYTIKCLSDFLNVKPCKIRKILEGLLNSGAIVEKPNGEYAYGFTDDELKNLESVQNNVFRVL